MTIRYRSFALGMVAGIGVTFCLGATVPQSPPEPLRPVEVTLHRFDRKPGSEATFREWIDYLRSHHREAVATLGRERTYFEAMFIAPDEPRRLYWLEVKGAGGKPVESSDHELDRRHIAYMDAVLIKGSHARLQTENVLVPDFIVRAVAAEQREER
ncbi:DUF6176 family protein [Sphingomonas melonis]